MTGLENILSQITSEAREEADRTLASAREQVAELLQRAQVEADERCAAIAARADRDVKDAASRAESAAGLQKRRALLAARQELIGAAIEKAHATLCALPDSAYFDTLLKLIAKHAQPGKGSICFNQKDLARLPADFSSRIAGVLPEGASLDIAAETRPIDGGFVLIYGGIEENCSFSALFASGRESMQDLARQLLFS